MCENIEGVLKIEDEVGNKKVYDPRSYLKKAEASVAARLQLACDELKSSGNTIYKA
jgi:fructose-bisphosphate aldolase class II